ncbi:MAG TPA: NAD-dependent epimerase/dehydratase family protein [Gaiellaceae bacterium]|nr:NAD-dependent epimerase/dehydratase family protein [Gaiellaceae bacterium]
MTPLGLVEWFEVGEEERVERVLGELRRLGVRHLRTGVSWADWYREGGREWYEWLLPKLADEVELLPCVVYTPPSIAVVPKAAAPPRRPRDYADFLDLLIDLHGEAFEHVELWNEPNNIAEWDWRLDLNWEAFGEMISAAAFWVHQRGKRSVLGGMSPLDPNWLDLLAGRGALRDVDVVGIHGFPGTWEVAWEDWPHVVAKVREVMARHELDPEIWITEAGYSTWRNDEFGQVRELATAMAAPVERTYWYAAEDLQPDRETVGGFHTDVRHYHIGIHDTHGEPKLAARLWADGGAASIREAAALGTPPLRPVRVPVTLVTGGAGFVGCNVADRLLTGGKRVRVLDNLSRPGVERNLRWLAKRDPGRLEIEIGDLRDPVALAAAVRDVDEVFHLAAQVAVTTSLERPDRDFGVNLDGTIKLLEALRRLPEPAPLLFTSTNKVYGSLDDLELHLDSDRWLPADAIARGNGIDERRPLDFCTPYGCSKGAADQYVLDYAASYGLPTVVFRMSCIYGPHQHGTEDQGWVAHFLLRALADAPVTIYGDGCQVRDLLYVDDLVEAMLLAQRHIGEPEVGGQAFNIGGGPANAVSLFEVLEVIAGLHGHRPELELAEPRQGDQRWYVSNTRRFGAATGWEPMVTVEEGIESLYRWLLNDLGTRRVEKVSVR